MFVRFDPAKYSVQYARPVRMTLVLLTRIKHFPSVIAADIANLIYPPRCISCGGAGSDQSPHFCGDCSTQLNILSASGCCPACASPLPYGANCGECNGRGIFPFEKIAALAPFRDPLRKLIYQIKYHHRWPVAEVLADRLLGEARVRAILDQADVVAAVPLHWSRQIGRGYNQAETIARWIASKRKLKIAYPIIRVRNTATQTSTHSRAQRMENLRQAVGLINGKKIRGKHVVLIDDVMTTAATLKSAARAIMQAEPASVSAVVLAGADPRRQDF